jgi:rhodanese-related sulfurtransferase
MQMSLKPDLLKPQSIFRKTLPMDKPIVFVCGTGARSGESFYMLQDLRPEMKNVYYLEGELTFKKDGSFEIKEPVS